MPAGCAWQRQRRYDNKNRINPLNLFFLFFSRQLNLDVFATGLFKTMARSYMVNTPAFFVVVTDVVVLLV